MLTKFLKSIMAVWERIFHPSPIALNGLTYDKQTKLSWAILINSYDKVPEIFKGYFDSIFTVGQSLPYIVQTPSYEGFLQKATEKLVFNMDQETYILEKANNGFSEQCYPFENINYIEKRSVLLESHIVINGRTKQGEPNSNMLRFNTISSFMFTPIVNQIRLASLVSKPENPGQELEKFNNLTGVNKKFRNFSKHSLLADEKVVGSIFSPQIRASLLDFFRKTHQKIISPAHMIILTDCELITIQEEVNINIEDHYGGVWTFIPLKKIKSISLQKGDGNLHKLSFYLPDQICLEYMLRSSMESDIHHFLDLFGELPVEKVGI